MISNLKKSLNFLICEVLMVALFDSCFDFAIFDEDGNLDFLIEYQGKQHYEPVAKFGGARGLYQQQYNDKQKRRFCAMNDIKLVEIPHWEENLISFDYIFSKAGY